MCEKHVVQTKPLCPRVQTEQCLVHRLSIARIQMSLVAQTMEEFYMKNQVVGIDISKLKFDVCAIFNEKFRRKTFTNNVFGCKKFVSWMSEIGLNNPHICMEATGCYSEQLADFLYNSGHKVSVVNPLPIKAFRTSKMLRQKTDKADAEVIAHFCQQNKLRLWKSKEKSPKELHEITVAIDSLKKQMNAFVNMKEKQYTNQIVKQHIDDSITFIKSQIRDLENEAKKIVGNDEKMKNNFEIITSIKGVGERLAHAILADMNFEDFENGKQFAAFCGVTPALFESGSSVRKKSKISKMGSAKIRKILYMNALVVKNRNPHFTGFVRRLEARGKCAKVIIVAIMRKLLTVIFGMLKSGRKFDDSLAFNVAF